jgi:N-acetylneuraminic acid mutarotase
MEGKMRTWCLSGLLVSGWLLLSACGLGKPQIATVEVTRIVPEPIPVTAEVTRIVREPIPVTAEVTRIVQETVPVTAEVTRIVRETVVVTPAPPLVWSVDITQGVALPIPLTWHTATVLNDNRILLVGGGNGMDEQYALVEIFDPVNGMLTPAAPLHTPRHEHSATLLQDNRVLVVGGYNFQRQWLQDAEVYDPSANTWTIVPPLYPHGVQHTATRLLDGRVLVVGGCIGSGVCTARVEIFDPHTNTWTEAAPLPSDRASHSAALLDDGRVLVAGGASVAGIPAGGEALLYDPLANAWMTTGPMVMQRTQASMVKLSDGRVLVAGGLNISDDPIAFAGAEIYDPATYTWTAAASLSQPRYAYNLVLLPQGQVLAVGGANNYDNPWTESSFVRDIEIYDPRSDRWFIAGKLPLPATYAADAFLPDGRLWVTGGGAGHAIVTAWSQTWLIRAISTQP